MTSSEPNEAALRREVSALRARVAQLERGQDEQTEAALQASPGLFTAVFQNAPAMMWLLDRDRRVLEANRATEEAAARAAREQKGLPFGNAVHCVHSLDHPEGCGYGPSCQACSVRRVVSQTFETKQPHYQVEARLTFGLERERHDQYLLISTSLPDLPSDRRMLLCILDITERKRAEQALRGAHELLERVFAATHVCIAYMDKDFNFIRVNRAYAEADDRSPESLLGRNHFDLYPDQENQVIFRRVVATGEPCSFHGKPFEYAEHPERGVTYWDWSLHPVKDTAGQVDGLLLCLVDVTKREQAERLARERQAALARMSRISTLGEMASGLAHELSQPLGAISAYADACKKVVASTDRPELIETADKIVQQARRAAEIIRRVRSFIGKQEPVLSTVDVNDLIRETVALTEAQARREGITVALELDQRLPQVQADSIQIQQVIVNLVRNGFEAIGPGRGSAGRLTIRSSLDEDGAVAIAVSDTGSGLSAEASARMFEPFFTTKTGGMGLGLSISRSIIQAHGGRLWATPHPDGGTTFRLTLPTGGGTGHAGP